MSSFIDFWPFVGGLFGSTAAGTSGAFGQPAAKPGGMTFGAVAPTTSAFGAAAGSAFGAAGTNGTTVKFEPLQVRTFDFDSL